MINLDILGFSPEQVKDLLTIVLMLAGAFALGYLFRNFLSTGYKQRILRDEKTIAELKQQLQHARQEASDDSESAQMQARLLQFERSNELLKADLEVAQNDRARLKAQLTEMERQGFGKKAEQLTKSEPLKAGTKPSGAEEDSPVSSNKIVLDQLRKIEGIGPKIEEILHKHGILTFKMLAEADVDRVRDIVHSSNPAYKVHDPATWPEQAKLADLELWDELDLLQSKLKGGKKA